MLIGLIGPVQANVDHSAGPQELQGLVPLDVKIRVFAPRISAFAYTAVEFAIQQISYLDAGMTAAAAGCDVLVYNTLSQYGLAALKAAVDIPVVGPAESTFGFVPSLGYRFSIITVWPASTNFMTEALLREYGLECVRTHNVFGEDVFGTSARPDSFIASMQAGEDKLNKIVDACQRAVREDQIDYVVLGCTCMSPLATRIAKRCDVPVVNPLAVALKTAEMRVRLGLLPKGPRRPTLRPESYDLVRQMVDPVSSESTDCGVFCSVAWAGTDTSANSV